MRVDGMLDDFRSHDAVEGLVGKRQMVGIGHYRGVGGERVFGEGLLRVGSGYVHRHDIDSFRAEALGDEGATAADIQQQP